LQELWLQAKTPELAEAALILLPGAALQQAGQQQVRSPQVLSVPALISLAGVVAWQQQGQQQQQVGQQPARSPQFVGPVLVLLPRVVVALQQAALSLGSVQARACGPQLQAPRSHCRQKCLRDLRRQSS